MERELTSAECDRAAERLWLAAYAIQDCAPGTIYGVPRGGIPVSYLVQGYGTRVELVNDPEEAHLIVDDIVDSGRTKASYREHYPGTPFLALADFIDPPHEKGQWLVFPWEVGNRDTSADDLVVRLIQFIGENPNREGLRDTPARVLKAWREWAGGYGQDVGKFLRVFDDGGENYDEMIVVREIPFYSHCEHHLAPFFGTATIAYIPADNRIVGLSKLSRVLDVFARRLQVQERLTSQVADALMGHLAPKGVAVLVRARHLCMESRGIHKQGHETVTSCLRGVFFTEDKARAEFNAIAR